MQQQQILVQLELNEYKLLLTIWNSYVSLHEGSLMITRDRSYKTGVLDDQ